MRKTVTVEVDDVLSLVACASTYGYADDVFFDGMAGMLDRQCSDEEIEAYAQSFLSDEMKAQGFGEDDAADARSAVTEWRDRYCKS
jgi:hypothetical protein